MRLIVIIKCVCVFLTDKREGNEGGWRGLHRPDGHKCSFVWEREREVWGGGGGHRPQLWSNCMRVKGTSCRSDRSCLSCGHMLRASTLPLHPCCQLFFRPVHLYISRTPPLYLSLPADLFTCTFPEPLHSTSPSRPVHLYISRTPPLYLSLPAVSSSSDLFTCTFPEPLHSASPSRPVHLYISRTPPLCLSIPAVTSSSDLFTCTFPEPLFQSWDGWPGVGILTLQYAFFAQKKRSRTVWMREGDWEREGVRFGQNWSVGPHKASWTAGTYWKNKKSSLHCKLQK